MSEMGGTLTTAPKGSGDYIGVGSGPLSGGYGDNSASLNPHVVNIDELVSSEIQALIEAGATPEEITAAMKKRAAEAAEQNSLMNSGKSVFDDLIQDPHGLNTPNAEEVGFDEARAIIDWYMS